MPRINGKHICPWCGDVICESSLPLAEKIDADNYHMDFICVADPKESK